MKRALAAVGSVLPQFDPGDVRSVLVIVFGGALCTLAAWGAIKQAEAPSVFQVAGLRLVVPRRPDVSYATGDGQRFFSIRLCARAHDQDPPPLGCGRLSSPLVTAGGVEVSVTEAQPDRKFSRLRERPPGSPPLAGPLIPIPTSRIEADKRGGEGWQLSRVQYLHDGDPIVTTTRGWPIAACTPHPWGTACSGGFLVGAAFVEARWSTGKGVDPDQPQVWAVTAVVDDAIRSLIKPELKPR